MKCSRCGTKLEVLFDVDVRDDGTPFTEKAVDPCPKCCPARKPIQWHPYSEPPPFDRHVVSVADDGRVRVTIRQRLSDRTNIAWCYLSELIDCDALAADARDAMEGEG